VYSVLQGGTKVAAVAALLPGNFSEKTLLAGNFPYNYSCQDISG
jgi:hypothetical protein